MSVHFQLEVENQNLRMLNQNQTEEVKILQIKLQGKWCDLSEKEYKYNILTRNRRSFTWINSDFFMSCASAQRQLR